MCSGQQSKLRQQNSLLLTRAEKRWGCAERSDFLVEGCFWGVGEGRYVKVNGSKWPFPHLTLVSDFIVQWRHRTYGRMRNIAYLTTRCCQSTLNRKAAMVTVCFYPRVSCYHCHNVFRTVDSQSYHRQVTLPYSHT